MPGRTGRCLRDAFLLLGEVEVIEELRHIGENLNIDVSILDPPAEAIVLLHQMMKILRKLAMLFQETRRISDTELWRKLVRKRRVRRKRRKRRTLRSSPERIGLEPALEVDMMMEDSRIDMTAGGIAGMRRRG